MTRENQCCTQSQAIQLKLLGVAQISLYCWHPSFVIPIPGDTTVTATGHQYKKVKVYNDKAAASAFTVAELLTLLPASIRFAKKWVDLRITKNDVAQEYGGGICYTVGYYTSDKELLRDWVYGNGRNSLPEAAADMLIMLIEKGVVKVEEVNQLQNT